MPTFSRLWVFSFAFPCYEGLSVTPHNSVSHLLLSLEGNYISGKPFYFLVVRFWLFIMFAQFISFYLPFLFPVRIRSLLLLLIYIYFICIVFSFTFLLNYINSLNSTYLHFFSLSSYFCICFS